MDNSAELTSRHFLAPALISVSNSLIFNEANPSKTLTSKAFTVDAETNA